MNKTFKKLIALMLVLLMSLPLFTAAFAVFAEETPAVTTAAAADDEEEDEHVKTTFFEMFIDFFKSIWEYLKYIFYDVFLGKPAPKPPEAPTKYFNN